MSNLIRARQPIMTRLFPHQANRRYLIPSRVKGLGTPPAVALDFEELAAWLRSEGWLDAEAFAHHLTVNGGQILDRAQGDACQTDGLTPNALQVDTLQGLQMQGRCRP